MLADLADAEAAEAAEAAVAEVTAKALADAAGGPGATHLPFEDYLKRLQGTLNSIDTYVDYDAETWLKTARQRATVLKKVAAEAARMEERLEKRIDMIMHIAGCDNPACAQCNFVTQWAGQDCDPQSPLAPAVYLVRDALRRRQRLIDGVCVHAWVASEDDKLVGKLVAGGTFEEAAELLPGRTVDAIRNRWHRLSSNGEVPNTVRPRVRHENRQQWTAEEDAQVADGVREYGSQWRKIADMIPSRTANAVRNRWQRELAPRGGVGRGVAPPAAPDDASLAAGALLGLLGGRDAAAAAAAEDDDEEGEADADDGGSDETQLHPPSDFDGVELDDLEVDVEPTAAPEAEAEPDWAAMIIDDAAEARASLAPAQAPAEDGAVFLMQARSEGLELIRGPNTTGFKGVSFNSRAVSGRQFQAQPYYDGKQVYLGSYGTAEEAALMVARHLATRA